MIFNFTLFVVNKQNITIFEIEFYFKLSTKKWHMQKWLSDLEEVVGINSYTKNKSGVDSVGFVFQKWCESIGMKTSRHKRELIGDHLHFISSRTEGQKILLLGHLDTVFPEGTFEGFKQDEEWVYGAGVCDMKGGNIVALEALRNIYEQNKKICNVDMLLVSDEETGSDDSKFLSAEIAKAYDYVFVFEAAGENLEVVVGRKGIGTFTIDIEGKASHAGIAYHKGIDANLEASHKLIRLNALINHELGTVVNVGKMSGGVGANTVSPKASLLFEMRFTSISEKERLLREIGTITNMSYVTGTNAKLSGLIQRDVMEPSEAQFELIKSLERITGETIKTERRGGVSDANVCAGVGTTTLDGFGPFGDGDHTLNERALKSSFVSRIKLMSDILAYHQANLKL